jgi:hypothetical protein
MTLKRALAIALTAAAALPASAAAQAQINPPEGDNYLGPIFMKQGAGLVTGDKLGFTADTTNYTTQSSMYDPTYDANGNPTPGPQGPREPTLCEGVNSTYAKTIWSVFRAKQYGVINISASSGTFDEVIRVIPFKSPATDPTPELPGNCFDDVAGFSQTASGLVFPGEWFAVQVGGTINNTSHTDGGPMQVTYELGPPPALDGDALLFWRLQPLRVTSLVVQGVTRGAKVTLKCTKGACKNTTKTAKKPVWAKPIADVGPAPAGVHMKGGAAGGGAGALTAFRPIAHAAKTKFTLLSNKKVKKGGTITVSITAPGYIGKQFFWRVKQNALTNKQVSCTNPGSSTPHKVGKCHG